MMTLGFLLADDMAERPPRLRELRAWRWSTAGLAMCLGKGISRLRESTDSPTTAPALPITVARNLLAR
jgi:hypothetical protein